jgi:hypothetical protein
VTSLFDKTAQINEEMGQCSMPIDNSDFSRVGQGKKPGSAGGHFILKENGANQIDPDNSQSHQKVRISQTVQNNQDVEV